MCFLAGSPRFVSARPQVSALPSTIMNATPRRIATRIGRCLNTDGPGATHRASPHEHRLRRLGLLPLDLKLGGTDVGSIPAFERA